MKKLLLLLLLSTAAHSQSIDSLQNAVAAMPDDTNRVMAYRLLFRALYAEDRTGELLDVAEKGLVLSRKLNYAKGLSLFIFYKASALDILGRGQESIPLFEEGLLTAKKQGDEQAAADYHINLGTAHHSLGHLDKSLQNFLAAYEIYKRTGHSESLSKVLNNIGIVYRTQGKYERAEEIYKESLTLKQQLKDTLGTAATYQNLAALYSTTARKEEAILNAKKALAIYENLHRPDDVAGCHSLLGQVFYNVGNLPEAKAELQKAVAGYAETPNVEYGPSTYQLLGTIAANEEDFPTAEKYLRKGLEMARQFGQGERIFEILKELSKVEHALGKDANAYASLQEAAILRDSAVEKNRLSLMEEMQTKFDVAQKDSDLKINQLDLKQRTLERNWLIAGAGLLGLLSFAIFFGLRSRIRANKKIAAQESALQRQQIVQLEQENKLAALSAMIEGQEKERSRIAADLHDGLGGLLTSVKSHFNSLPKPSIEQDLFAKTNCLIDDACVEVRRISHNMMPRALALSGLPGALEDLAQDLEKQGVRCDLEILGLDNASLDPTQSITIYRIIQELTNNVVKHAQADHLLLQLIRRDGTLVLIAEDNGKGFDVQQALTKKGLGLSSIASRVKFLQGSIEWDSVPGEGTVVSITLPMVEHV
ncbi:MAG: tetratricopeptide repeat protein [Phycisphaerae bacterium]|nr:tetratricopeptide repeat protein [Saprospiraceae bacterium]